MNTEISTAKVDDKVKFAEEKQAYTIQARGDRYIVCTKPFNARKTVLYTVIDLEYKIRGTENLVFGAGAETRQQCEEMLMRLEGRDKELGWATEVSHRNNIPMVIEKIIIADKNKPIEVIYIGDQDECMLARGHIDPSEFISACERECGEPLTEEWSVPKHDYCRVVPEKNEGYLYFFDQKPGRGVFKITHTQRPI